MSRNEGYMEVDPAEVYFTHSRVRPFFSGCGRRLEETLALLVEGRMDIEALPQITVLRGAGGAAGGGRPIIFSLNNRRLWVLKELRAAGKLQNNVVRVRAKDALPRERDRYTASKCSLTATLMGVGSGGGGGGGEDSDGDEDGEGAATMLAPAKAAADVSPPVVLHASILKQVKTLKEKLKTGGKKGERDVQAKMDDFQDQGLLKASDEAALWALLRG